MNRKTKSLWVGASLVALLFIGTAIWLNRGDHARPNGADDARSPLGALVSRASAVSNLKARMGELREVYPTLEQFAHAHQDDLPTSLAELRPYLSAKLAFLDDEHWELPSNGKFSLLVKGSNANTAILLQEKGVLPDHPRIVVYADGHIEYRK